MRLPFTRRPLPPAPPELGGAHRQVLDTATAEIAVGSLSGVAPSRIIRHVLIVLDDENNLHLSTSCCKAELPELIGRAGAVAVYSAMEPGPCEHGGHS